MALENKVALITGGAQGIGKSIAARLARDGAAVVTADLNLDLAQRTADELQEAGHRAMAVKMDVSNEDDVGIAVSKIADTFGPVTILVNNAGIIGSTPALEVPLETWQLNLNVMLTGSLLCARAVLPKMVASNWGRVINIGSMMSNVAYGKDVAYCTTKSGILGLTRSLAVEFGPHNVCVNAVCPGNIMTEMLIKVGEQVEERDGLPAGSFLEQRASAIPLRRLGEPEDIANVVSFLCSSDADYVSGQSIHVNGALYLT